MAGSRRHGGRLGRPVLRRAVDRSLPALSHPRRRADLVRGSPGGASVRLAGDLRGRHAAVAVELVSGRSAGHRFFGHVRQPPAHGVALRAVNGPGGAGGFCAVDAPVAGRAGLGLVHHRAVRGSRQVRLAAGGAGPLARDGRLLSGPANDCDAGAGRGGVVAVRQGQAAGGRSSPRAGHGFQAPPGGIDPARAAGERARPARRGLGRRVRRAGARHRDRARIDGAGGLVASAQLPREQPRARLLHACLPVRVWAVDIRVARNPGSRRPGGRVAMACQPRDRVCGRTYWGRSPRRSTFTCTTTAALSSRPGSSLRTSPPMWHRLWLLVGVVTMQALPLGLPVPQLIWDAAWLAILAVSSFFGSGASGPASRPAASSAGHEGT